MATKHEPAVFPTAEDMETIRKGIAVWCEAQRRAGFKDDDVVVVDFRQECRLSAVNEIAAAYVDAMTQRHALDYGDGFPIGPWAGVELAMRRPDGLFASAFISVDSRGDFGDGRPIFEGGRWIVREPDGQMRTEIDWRINNWNSASKLVCAFGGYELTNPLFGADNFWFASRWMLLDVPLLSVDRYRGSEDPVHHAALSFITESCDHVYPFEISLNLLKELGTWWDLDYFLGRPRVRLEMLADADAKMRLLNGNVDLLVQLPEFAKDTGGISFVVPGLIPAGILTLLIGSASVGKSTCLHDLALLVGTPPHLREAGRRWLGVPSEDIRHGTTVFLSGEDDNVLMTARAHDLGYPTFGRNTLHLPSSGRTLDDTLASLSGLGPISLLVVDPARRFLVGDEDDSKNVDEFLNKLEKFAAEKGCAAVVSHHLKRGAKPNGPHAVLDAMRGSQVFIDRARVILGMTMRNRVVSVAVAKSNLPPSAGVGSETRRFARDDQTLRLLPVEDRKDASPSVEGAPTVDVECQATTEDDGAVEAVAAAVCSAYASGTKITKTGRRGVFERSLPGLENMSRAEVRNAIDRALKIGQLRIVDGRLAPPEASIAPEGSLPPLPLPGNPLPATAATVSGLTVTQ